MHSVVFALLWLARAVNASCPPWALVADSGDIAKRTDLYAITPKLVATLSAQREAEAKQAAQTFGTPISDPTPYRYVLGPQDVLRITVWNHPELTNPSGTANELSGRVINADGTGATLTIGAGLPPK